MNSSKDERMHREQSRSDSTLFVDSWFHKSGFPITKHRTSVRFILIIWSWIFWFDVPITEERTVSRSFVRAIHVCSPMFISLTFLFADICLFDEFIYVKQNYNSATALAFAVWTGQMTCADSTWANERE